MLEIVQKAGHRRGARVTQWYIGPADLDGEAFSRAELKQLLLFLHTHVPVDQDQSWDISKERWTDTLVYYYASKTIWPPGIKYGAYTLDALLEKLTHYYDEMMRLDDELQHRKDERSRVEALLPPKLS